MTNPNFTPNYSTNEIWRGDNAERCLTDDLDAMDAIHASLPSTYAAKNHTHTGYATSSDVTALQDALSNKANINHTHTGYAPSTHNHNDIYYTESEIDSKLSSKADSTSLTAHTNNSDLHVTASNKTNWNAAYTHSQAAHAPSNAEVNQNAFSNVAIGDTTIAADTKTDTLTFVAGNNVTITPNATNDSVTISATNTTYTHPTTAGNKHIPAGGSSGQILKWSSNGTAVWGNESGGGEKIITTTGTGESYIASVDGVIALTPGISFVMIPHVTSAKTMPTLNVNGLGAKNIRMRISNSTTSTTPLSSENMLVANKPTRVMYDGTQWIIDIVRPNVTNLYGTLTVEQGGTGGKTAAAARTNLDVYSKAEVEDLIAQALEIGIQSLKNSSK
nr:MAG TPA: tail repeat-like protein [Caudoviricetes sp.]